MSYDFEKPQDQALWLKELRDVMAKNPHAEFHITGDDTLWLAFGPENWQDAHICGDNARVVKAIDMTINALRVKMEEDAMANGRGSRRQSQAR